MSADDTAGNRRVERAGTGGVTDESGPVTTASDGDVPWLGVAVLVAAVTTVVVLVALTLTGRVDEAYAATEGAVRTARGWPGLGIVFVYSVLIAAVLPLPSEVVLAAPLDLGLGRPLRLAVIVFVSSLGKAVGSVVAFHAGQEAKRAGPVVRRLRRSRFDLVRWSETTTADLARRFGYVGLALALSVPFFPDTVSLYAFSVLGRDYRKFAAAVFIGGVGRLLVTLGVAGAVLTLF